ncbi:MAG: ankyrin repeat domain-containing protein [Candidatus Micrarchaeota archaeon]|nr:ankyrin repeat domain-containing protein [Candidatus Micrarchaeota archaeon]
MQERKPFLRRIIQRIKPKKLKVDILPSRKQALPATAQKQLNKELMDTAGNGHYEQVIRLIKKGAEIAPEDNGGWTALHSAANGTQSFHVCILIMQEYSKSGGDIKKLVSAKDAWGQTPLHKASFWGKIKICKLLIKAGADISAKDDRWGYTALHCAAENGHTKACEFLINEYAKSGGNMMELISSKGNDGDTALRFAVKQGRTKTAQFLAAKSLEAMFGNEIAVAFSRLFGKCADS